MITPTDGARLAPGSALRLCLYIAGDWPNSQRALTNLRAILLGRDDIELEVVDVLEDPQRGMDAGIYVTPQLIRISPTPTRRILGDLSNRLAVTGALSWPLETAVVG